MGTDRALLFRLATSSRFERGVRATRVGESLAWRSASRYVAGPTFADAARVVERLHLAGVGSSVDEFGELVDDPAVVDEVTQRYCRRADGLAGLPGDTWLSVDLTHLGLDADPAGCVDRVAAIATALPPGRRLQVGAEDHTRTTAVLRCVLAVAERGLAPVLGATVQANLRRTPRDLEQLVGAGVHVRLVKGAYVEPPDRALPYGAQTDIAYLHLAHRLAEAGAAFALATHDDVVREALLAALGPIPVEQLLGVRPETVSGLVARGVPTRVYVPFGRDWFRYWMRRLAESRGA